MTGARSHLVEHLGIFVATTASVFTLGAACMLWLGARVVVEALRLTIGVAI